MTTQVIKSKSNIVSDVYLTVAKLKTESIVDLSDYSDAKLQEYINRAIKMIDLWLGSSVAYGLFTDNIRCIYDYPRNGIAVQLPRRPIISIKKIVTTFSPSVSITWDTPTKIATWRINKEVGYIEYFGIDLVDYALNLYVRDPLASNVTPMAEVTYYSGYTTIPDNIAEATKILTEQLIRTDQGEDMDLTSLSIGNYREGYKKNSGVKGMGVVGGIDQVERLLRPYRQPGQTMFVYGPC
jgi:hypothetical protein